MMKDGERDAVAENKDSLFIDTCEHHAHLLKGQVTVLRQKAGICS